MNKNFLFLACTSALASGIVGCPAKQSDTNDSGVGPSTDSGAGSDVAVVDGGDSAPPPDGKPDGTPTTDSGTTDSGTSDSATTTDSATSADGDGGSTSATSCSTGTLFAGNPSYGGDPTDRPTSGTGIHADPPFQWQNLVFTGTWLYSREEAELWGVDLSAASPVETRVAGLNDPSGAFPYGFGACSSARFAKIEGLAALPDGSIVVSDVRGNGVLHVTSPTTSSCAVELWAGNSTPSADLGSGALPDAGDTDGPGASAQFNGPGALVTDDAGNTYVYDRGNRKVKKIAADSAHTVTTLAALASGGPDNITNLTRIGSMIYGIGTNGTQAFVLGFDSSTGATTTVLGGGGDVFPPLDSTTFPAIAGITTDGTGLIVSGKGYLWYLTVGGTLTQIAGIGPSADFPPSGYDPTVAHPAMSLVLPPSRVGSAVGSSDYIAYWKGAVYFRGFGNGSSAFIERIACP